MTSRQAFSPVQSRSVSPSSFSTIKMKDIVLILFLEAFIF